MKLLLVLLLILAIPGRALAHDDPVVTVRVMCDGFNVLDMDQVLGELSDSAIVHFDGTVQGSRQIQAWVKQQMDNDLRIQIVEIGTPHQLPDGYTLTWTGRFSRQDWRQQGLETRDVFNTVQIHNGRITEWTATLDAGSQASTASAVVPAVSPSQTSGMPQVAGVPISLWLAAAVAVVGVTVVARGAIRR